MTHTFEISPETRAAIERTKAEHEQLKLDAVGMTRRQCIERCHELTIANGGKCADLRTRAYRWTFQSYMQVCRSVQAPETLKQWDDEQMEESRRYWAEQKAKSQKKLAAKTA